MAKWFLFALALVTTAGAMITVLARHETSQRIATLQSERRLAETRHGRIEYAVWGEGPPVLVIHGAGGGFDQGWLLAEAVGGEGFLWISVSRFGYLGSAMPEHPSPTAQAEAFADLLDALNFESAHILAISGGVPPALKFAERFPAMTDRMALLSSAPFTPFSPDVEDRPAPEWVYAALLGNDVVYWLLTKIARGALAKAFDARPDLTTGLSVAEEAFIDDLVDGFLPASQRIAGLANEGAAVDPRVTYDLEAIHAPVLVVHARDDSLNPFEVAETISGSVGGARLLTFDSGGHLLLGHHGEVERELVRFLSAERPVVETR